jgi:hypothetical protein
MKRVALVLLVSLAVAPMTASAQVVWDAPTMIRPGAPSGLSLLLLEPYPGNEIGALVLWRQSPAPVGLGLRVGIAEDPSGDLAALFGIDVSGTLARLSRGWRAPASLTRYGGPARDSVSVRSWSRPFRQA